METFVVQIWALAGESNTSGMDMRGYVEHVGTGRREAFRCLGDLVAFLESPHHEQPREVGDDAPPVDGT